MRTYHEAVKNVLKSPILFCGIIERDKKKHQILAAAFSHCQSKSVVLYIKCHFRQKQRYKALENVIKAPIFSVA